jgi:mannose-1-phosphate guanylyltransferase
MLHAVIMAGGSGTRFWPKSRRSAPKQLLSLFDHESLLQATVARVEPLVAPERIWVITGQDQSEATRRQLPMIPSGNIVGEPGPRDTAPCVGLAAAILQHVDPEALMLVVPADHVIKPASAFQKTIRLAIEIVEREPDALVTLGVRPTRPETGYGYIERGELVETRESIGISRVKLFREKPDKATAEAFLASGQFAWNAGVFLWRAATIRSELSEHRPDIGAAVERIAHAIGSPDESLVIEREYNALPRVPIDKAVLEHARRVYVLEVTYDWSDVGDWRSLAELLPSDLHCNTMQGPVHALDAKRCTVIADDGKLIALLGTEDLVVVQSQGATLVAARDQLDNLKKLVEGLATAGFGKYL